MQKLMSKLLPLLAITGILAASTPLSSVAQRPNPPKREGKEKRDPKVLKRLTDTLKLTPEQVKSVRPIVEKMRDQRNAIERDTKLTDEQKKEKARASRDSAFDQIKKILTPEQKKIMEEKGKKGAFKKKKTDGAKN